jgi:tRNA U34 5-carboxymethylaminomethyl modifying enzyme MnmG/GidA
MKLVIVGRSHAGINAALRAPDIDSATDIAVPVGDCLSQNNRF